MSVTSVGPGVAAALDPIALVETPDTFAPVFTFLKATNIQS